jgi:hypothetical protein
MPIDHAAAAVSRDANSTVILATSYNGNNDIPMNTPETTRAIVDDTMRRTRNSAALLATHDALVEAVSQRT